MGLPGNAHTNWLDMIHIKEGDHVDVYWDSTPWEKNVIVTYIPVGTGDCWHFMREDGTVIVSSYFAKLERTHEATE